MFIPKWEVCSTPYSQGSGITAGRDRKVLTVIMDDPSESFFQAGQWHSHELTTVVIAGTRHAQGQANHHLSRTEEKTHKATCLIEELLATGGFWQKDSHFAPGMWP